MKKSHRNDFNRSGSVSSNHSSGRPVRPAPAVPRNSQRRQAPIPPPRCVSDNFFFRDFLILILI